MARTRQEVFKHQGELEQAGTDFGIKACAWKWEVMSSGGFHCLMTTWFVCSEFKAQVYLTPQPYIYIYI